MGAPAHDTGHGEDRGVELQGKIQHAVYKAAVEVHIGADAFVDFAFLADDLGGQPFHHGIKGEFLFPSLFHGETLDKGFEDVRTGVREGVDRMAHSIDKSCMVKGFLVEQSTQISAYLFLIGPVFHLLLHILEHPYHLDIRAAVPGTL